MWVGVGETIHSAYKLEATNQIRELHKKDDPICDIKTTGFQGFGNSIDMYERICAVSDFLHTISVRCVR